MEVCSDSETQTRSHQISAKNFPSIFDNVIGKKNLFLSFLRFVLAGIEVIEVDSILIGFEVSGELTRMTSSDLKKRKREKKKE